MNGVFVSEEVDGLNYAFRPKVVPLTEDYLGSSACFNTLTKLLGLFRMF